MPKRPINADVPAPEEETKEQSSPPGKPDEEVASPKPIEKREKKVASPKPVEKRAAEPKPLAPKLLAGLVVLAIAFIVVAIVGGSGGTGDSTVATGPASAPAPALSEESASDEGAAPPETAESLGYPGFATDNTTRVGGADAAANAAAVALAVFPSTTPSQRPAAVTLVSEEDWAGAIAAAVLMAPPIRAPLLFSAAAELPEATSEALEALDPRGDKSSGGASFFAVGAVALPGGAAKTTRIDSGDPASTAAQIATLRDRLFGGPPKHVIVAPSASPDIAMPAAAWAARSGDPVLYTETGKLPQPTAAALERHPKVPVYVLGPSTAVSSAVVREIGKIAKRVKRVSGEDAVANALAFARYGDGDFGWNVNDPGHGFVLTRSDSPLEAAAAAALSASGTWGPLLLTDDAGTLPAEVRSYFLDVKPGYTTNPTRAFYNHVWVIGDQEAIDVNQQAEVNELAELAKIGGEG
jgi:hypothetical protein